MKTLQEAIAEIKEEINSNDIYWQKAKDIRVEGWVHWCCGVDYGLSKALSILSQVEEQK